MCSADTQGTTEQRPKPRSPLTISLFPISLVNRTRVLIHGVLVLSISQNTPLAYHDSNLSCWKYSLQARQGSYMSGGVQRHIYFFLYSLL